jgi:hypothetical protein
MLAFTGCALGAAIGLLTTHSIVDPAYQAPVYAAVLGLAGVIFGAVCVAINQRQAGKVASKQIVEKAEEDRKSARAAARDDHKLEAAKELRSAANQYFSAVRDLAERSTAAHGVAQAREGMESGFPSLELFSRDVGEKYQKFYTEGHWIFEKIDVAAGDTSQISQIWADRVKIFNNKLQMLQDAIKRDLEEQG